MRLADFQTMHMCPVCRKVICRFCKREGKLVSGQCAKDPPCENPTAPRRE